MSSPLDTLDANEERRLQSDEAAESRIESRACGLTYSSASASNCCSMPCESGLRSGEMAATSPVYLTSKLETSSSGSSSSSAGTYGGSSLHSSSSFQLSARKNGCALTAAQSISLAAESGLTPKRCDGSLVRRPRISVRASLVSHGGSLSLVCTILRCSSLASRWYHGASPVIISKRSTPSAQPSMACPHAICRTTSGAMYSVVPTSTGLPLADVCVADALSPKDASPKSHSLMWPLAQMSTFSGLRSR